MDIEETGTVNIRTVDNISMDSTNINDKGGKNGGRNNTRRKESDGTIKHLCI